MQAPPKLFISFLVYGDLLSTPDVPALEKITEAMGVAPSIASIEDDILIWQYDHIKDYSSWELPILIGEMLELLNAEEARNLSKTGLYLEIKATAYVTDSHPELNFPEGIIELMASFDASLDVDIIPTAAKDPE